MTPKTRSLPIEPLRPGQVPPRSPRGFVAARIHGTQHLTKRGHDRTLCGAELVAWERSRPTAVCMTCAAIVARLA
jgi:hypothetical protein